MKTFLVVNPESANGQTGRKWPEMAAEAGRLLGAFGHAFTSGPMDAARLARKALDEGYRCIVAVGGDGTINEVVNGLFENGRALDSNVALGVIPRGTGGDFRRSFAWDLDMGSALERLHRGMSKPLDVGLLEYQSSDGKIRTRCFANVCSFGVSGQVDREVSRGFKSLGGKLGFMLGSAKAMLSYRDQPVELSFDGGPSERLSITTVAVANGRYFGGGMCVAPGADASDGLFDVTIWSGYSLTDFALRSKSIYDGSHVELAGTRTLRCKTLEARSPVEVLLDVDGEQPGTLPCKVEVLPAALRLCV